MATAERIINAQDARTLAVKACSACSGQLLESDRDSRKLRMRRIAEDAYVTLPDPDRAAFAAYTRGVNAFIATHLKNLPLEFTLLGYEPPRACAGLYLSFYRPERPSPHPGVQKRWQPHARSVRLRRRSVSQNPHD